MSERHRVTTAVGWSLLTLLGFAAALSVIEAGQSVGYQHYLPLDRLSSRPWSVGVLLVQALAAVAALRGNLAMLGRRALELLPGWRLPFFAALMIGSSAILGRDLPRFAGELLLSSCIQLVSLATTLLAVRAIPPDTVRALAAMFTRVLGAERPSGDMIAPDVDRFGIVISLLVFASCALLSVVVYEMHPHLADEVAYLFQARTFADGRLSLPNPPVDASFTQYLLTTGAKGWYSPVPPGLSVAYVPGVWIGAPWLVNPVLTGLNTLLAYLVLQPLVGRRTARLSTLLLALSPWNLFLGMSFMPHALTLTCALLATLGVITARRTGHARWAWLGGFALGWLASVRQLDALVMAGVLGLWSIGLGGRRLRLGGTAGLVLGSIIATVPLLAFNRHFTGKPGTFPMMAYIDGIFGKGANDYGFGKNRGLGWALDPNPGHGPIDGLINAALNTVATQVELFGWSVGSLMLVYVFVLRGRLAQADRLMLAVIAATWLAYFFNYFSGGPDFGARYWFLMIVPLATLTARGALTLSDSRPDGDARTLSGMALLTLGALVIFMPWRAIDRYWHYRGMRPDIVSLAASRDFGNSLVFVAGRELPDYTSAAVFNPLDLGEPVPVYVRHDSPASDSAVIAAFPGRRVWFVDGPTVSRNSYVVRAGPFDTGEALRVFRRHIPESAPSAAAPPGN